ncbi:DnaB-like helicase C-terminal domain-containing protein [Paenibacillus larvae]|nr:DnaB-like helicase C-terminal domain-containing protein [Paenibacillus larvae]MDT2306396.1 DnaB-like helicase C-terminal domain-containing protein [Paenibacillus larvae]
MGNALAGLALYPCRRPSVGKTAKALQLAYGVAKNNPDGGCVLFFSQEMGANELKDRLVSNISGVNYIRLTQKKRSLLTRNGNEWKKPLIRSISSPSISKTKHQ